jgi:replication factor A1
LGEYLAFLSAKFSIDPEKFFRALVSLKEGDEVSCGNLSIEFRGRIRKDRIFLMTNTTGVVGQFRVPESFLAETDNPIRRFMDCDRVRRYQAKKAYVAQSSFIGGLIAGMSNITLSAKVLEIQKPASVFTRYGQSAVVANALIGDTTGTIKLCLWDPQAHVISEGDTVRIKNARAFVFRGEKQLRLGRTGTISVEQEKAITT